MSMNILVIGGNTTNKGAYLMLLSIEQQVKSFFPDAKLVLSPTLDLTELLSNFEVLNFPIFNVGHTWVERGLTYPRLTKLVYKYYKKTPLTGTVGINDIDLVLDVSGFSFGDKWGLNPIKNLELIATFFKKRKIPLVLMPQAFGPFEKLDNQLALQAFEKCQLIFARDPISYEHMKSLGLKNVSLSGDITLTLDSKASLPHDFPISEPFISVVPNIRMTDKANESWKLNYEDFLRKTVSLIQEKKKFKVLILIHSTTNGGDAELANRLYNDLKTEDLYIYSHENPLVLKRILKESEFVIGSRFHALASSLSSYSPSIGTSWQHKYEMLFKLFDQSNYCFPEYDDSIYERILELHDNDSLRAHLVEVLKNKTKDLRIENEKMWNGIKKSIV